MIGGMTFVVLSRRRGFVRRAHCLLLGICLAFSLPAAALLTSKAIDRIFGKTATPVDFEDDPDLADLRGPAESTLVVIAGVILIPFGALGGWVFWRVGVYPARPKLIDVAPVFD